MHTLTNGRTHGSKSRAVATMAGQLKIINQSVLTCLGCVCKCSDMSQISYGPVLKCLVESGHV